MKQHLICIAKEIEEVYGPYMESALFERERRIYARVLTVLSLRYNYYL